MEENKKATIEIKKINKNSNEIEWTETLEIPYDVSEKISDEEKKKIEEQYANNNEKPIQTNFNNEMNDTTLLNKNSNPFHQPSMNTLEFEQNDTILIANIFKENNKEVTFEDEIETIKKLFNEKMISKKEFELKKREIELKYNRENK